MKKLITFNEEKDLIIPHNLAHLYMYMFMIKDKDYFGSEARSRYNRHLFLNEGLETIFKQIYPKVYTIILDGHHYHFKPTKFQSNELETNNIWFIDTGRKITIVIGEDASSSLVASLFGQTTEEIESLCELPTINESLYNVASRRLIEILRSGNWLYFLRVEVMRQDSYEFEVEFGNYLYVAENHRKFLKQLFQL